MEIKNTKLESSSKDIKIHPNAFVDSNAELHEGVIIASGAIVGPNVIIGEGSEIGPNSNYSGLPAQSKWLLSVGMILGRLEIFAILIIFLPSFWRK